MINCDLPEYYPKFTLEDIKRLQETEKDLKESARILGCKMSEVYEKCKQIVDEHEYLHHINS